MKKELLKQDINFLECPLWLQGKIDIQNSNKHFSWKDLDGFLYESAYKPPVKTDIIFLYALLLKSQKDKWSETVELSRYQLLEKSGLSNYRNTYWYKRIEESLKRWMHIVVTFDNTFYDGSNRIYGQFHIIEHWKLDKETKRLIVRFSPEWLNQIKHSTYYKIIDFDQIKALHSPLATRLYEILVKSFQGRNIWSCGAKKLADKIPMKERYAAHIIPKIQTAVKRINEKTELQIKLEVKRPERGKALFVFTLEEESQLFRDKDKVKEAEQVEEAYDVIQEGRKEKPTDEKVEGGLDKLIELLPVEYRGHKTLHREMAIQLKKRGFGYVKENILYSNQNATEKYRIYLLQALQKNWGEGFLDELNKKEEERKAALRVQEEKRRKEKEEAKYIELAAKQQKSLSAQEKEELEEQIKASLSPELLQSSMLPTLLKLQTRAILVERIKKELSS